MELVGNLVGVLIIMTRKHFDSENMSLTQGRAIASNPMQPSTNLCGGSNRISICEGLAKHYIIILDRVNTSVFQQGKKERYLLILLL